MIYHIDFSTETVKVRPFFLDMATDIAGVYPLDQRKG